MMRRYDRERATQLVPLLESIAHEVAERTHEVRLIQGRLATLEGDDSEAACAETLDLRARLATHRREIHLAEAELERLGCIVDADHPWRVRIPGMDGRLEAGFQLDLLRSELGSSSTGTPAA